MNARCRAVVLATACSIAVACGQSHDQGTGNDVAGAASMFLRDSGVMRTDARVTEPDDAGKPAAAGNSAGSAGRGSAGRGSAGSTGLGGAGSADKGSQQPCGPNEDNDRGGLELITLAVDCAEADGDASRSRLTPDGRYVVFDSDADDLVPNDVNGVSDGFLFDLETRKLELISKKHAGQDPAGHAYLLIPSDDARYVAFMGLSFELTVPVPAEGIWIYLRDRETQTTRRFPGTYACAYWVDMTGDATFIVAEGYTRCDGGLEDGDYDSAFEYRVSSGGTRRLGSETAGEDNYRPAISRDGRFIVWATRPPMTRGTVSSQLQIFDRMDETVVTLPFQAFHFESTAISDSGRVIAFAQNRQVYRYDRDSDELTTVSKSESGEPGDDWSSAVSMSGDGRYLVFMSDATNLVTGDTNGVSDILLYDAEGETLERISVAPDGAEADGDSKNPYISGNGAKVSFVSKARNLLPLATSGNYQLYVRTLAHSM